MSLLKRSPFVALAGAALLATTLLPWAQVSWAQDQGRSFHWAGKLATDQVIEIRNLNGIIDAEPATRDEVEVSAEKSGPRADEVKIEVAKNSDGVTICPIYPGISGSCGSYEWHSSNFHNDNTKVDFRIRVPRSVRFNAQNVNGSVNAEHMSKPVRASSVNGSVRVSTDAWAELSSVNGSIDCSMGSADWNGSLKIETVNGSIHLSLPSDTNADVKFRSVNGRLSSDFPLTVSGTLGGCSMTGKIGNGGRQLTLETVNGNVDLRRGGI